LAVKVIVIGFMLTTMIYQIIILGGEGVVPYVSIFS